MKSARKAEGASRWCQSWWFRRVIQGEGVLHLLLVRSKSRTVSSIYFGAADQGSHSDSSLRLLVAKRERQRRSATLIPLRGPQ